MCLLLLPYYCHSTLAVVVGQAGEDADPPDWKAFPIFLNGNLAVNAHAALGNAGRISK
jgi:hypothetical protein